jgi:hypothetical protein
MSAQQDNPYLIITLTDRPPVKIRKDDWPILAEATDSDCDSEYEFQANRTSKWALRVRQHDDGRAIVYGTYSHNSHFLHERNYGFREGELLQATPIEELPAAIRRVGRKMAEQDHCGDDARRWAQIINDCIADLPPVEI